MSDKVRVLHFMDGYADGGGIQEMVVRWIRNIDKSKFVVDVLAYNHTTMNPGDYRKRLKNLGSELFLVDSPEKSLEAGHQIENPIDSEHSGLVTSFRQTISFFRTHHYDVLHCNTSAKGVIVLACAKAAGVRVRILHSHCAKVVTKNPVKRLAAQLLKLPAMKFATHLAACSTEAGEFLFGDRVMRSGCVKIVPNAIDLGCYAYNPVAREDARGELGVEPATKVYADVARFVPQKNLKLLIRAFAEVVVKEPNSLLVLVGDGGERSDCELLARELGIADSVRFLGLRSDVARLDQAFDVFAMTSLFEGLPVSCIEAQASGLPCVMSDGITKEACVLPSSSMVPANASPIEWADRLIKTKPSSDRASGICVMAKAGFEIQEATKKLQQFYLEAVKG